MMVHQSLGKLLQRVQPKTIMRNQKEQKTYSNSDEKANDWSRALDKTLDQSATTKHKIGVSSIPHGFCF